MTITERRMDRMVDSVAHVFEWYIGGDWEKHHLDPGIADFTFGNPQEMPLPGLVGALQRNAEPKDKDWFAYKLNEAEPRAIVADSLQQRTGIVVPTRGHLADRRRVRRARRHDPRAVRRGRRGHLPVAAVVLLRADDRVVGREGRAGPPAGARPSTSIPTPSPRRSRRGRGRSSSTARTTRPDGSIDSPSSPRSAICSGTPRSATAGRSCCSRTSRTTGSSSTASTSTARPSTTPRRSRSTPTARRCWRRVSGSAGRR